MKILILFIISVNSLFALNRSLENKYSYLEYSLFNSNNIMSFDNHYLNMTLNQKKSSESTFRRFEVVFFLSVPLTSIFYFSLISISQLIYQGEVKNLTSETLTFAVSASLLTSLAVASDDLYRKRTLFQLGSLRF